MFKYDDYVIVMMISVVLYVINEMMFCHVIIINCMCQFGKCNDV